MNQQIKYRNRYNSPKGITIVALVVTIVIMLILVGVTVTIAINGGLIGTAKDSKEETRYTQVLAEKEMWEQEERPTERFGIKASTGAATFSSTGTFAGRTIVYGGGIADLSGTGNNIGITFSSSNVNVSRDNSSSQSKSKLSIWSLL